MHEALNVTIQKNLSIQRHDAKQPESRGISLEELELPRVGRSERPAWLLQPLFMLRILNFRGLTFEKIKPLLRKKRRIQQSRELTLIIDSFLLPKILSLMWGCL